MSEVGTRRRGPGWVRLGHGLHVPASAAGLAERLREWSRVVPDSAVFTHLTAAELRGWWLPAPAPGPAPVRIAVGEDERHPQRSGLVVTRLAEPPEIVLVSGLRVATAAETLLAVARDVGLLDLVALGDSALRRGECTLEELRAAAGRRRRGAPRLRTVIPLLDARSESPWESIMRVLFRAADLEVEPQRVIHDSGGRFVARADLWLVGTRRIAEYDGEVHRDQATHRRDLDRDRRLAEAGWQRYGYTAVDLLQGGGGVIASADALLGRSWDPRRLQRWRALVQDSSYGRKR